MSVQKTDSTSASMTCGKALIHLLHEYGVEYVFGMPGVHTLELYRGLENSPIKHISCRHEQGAGFMADGFSRVTGKPGVCFVITGPGLTNAMTAIAQAYSDSIPMLVISSVAKVGDLAKEYGRLHETKDQKAMLEPITEFSVTALAPEDIPVYISRAFSIFSSSRPRPVHIELPLDMISAPAPKEWKVNRVVAPPGPNLQAIDRAVDALAAAKFPTIIAGGGACGATQSIRLLSNHLTIPVFSTIAGKGIIPGKSPLDLGATLHLREARAIIEKSDVVLAVGTELAESEFLTSDPLPIKGELIRIDIDLKKLCDEHSGSIVIHSDATTAMALVADRANSKIDPPSDELVSARIRIVQDFRMSVTSTLNNLQRQHLDVLNLVQESIADDAVYFTDMTQIAYTGNAVFNLDNPRRWFHPAGYGTLGYGVPAAIGAQLADPARTVIAVVGDGGFLFTLQELATAVEEQLPVIIILWNNGSLGQIKDGMLGKGISPIGVDPWVPDLKTIAKGFGLEVHSPERFSELRSSLQRCSGTVPKLIEITPEIVCDTHTRT